MNRPSKEKAACKTCQHMEPEPVKCGRSIFYCMHPEAKTECLPHRIITRSRAAEIPTKTAPKWCPLNQKKKNRRIVMDIVKMIDGYKELLDRKDELSEATKENNKAIEEARKELTQAMIDAEMPKVSRNGYLYSLQDKTKYNKKGDIDEEAFFSVLEENGLGSIIKRTVDSRTLSSTMAAAAEENDGELPEEYEEYISVYQFYDIQKRKETNKAAKKAKQEKEA